MTDEEIREFIDSIIQDPNPWWHFITEDWLEFDIFSPEDFARHQAQKKGKR